MPLYKKISNYYDELFPLKKSRLSFITSLFEKEQLAILDIGCAGGELPLALTGKGHRLTGIDLDGDMIALAREKAKNRDLKVEFLKRDMAAAGIDFLPSSFDAVLCFGNTLVHLENLEKIEIFFKGVLKILKSGGIFILQIVNYQRVLAESIKELPIIESENFTFRREYFYDRAAHRIRFKACLTVKESGTVLESSESLYPLTFMELRALLENAGFSELRFFGNENKAPYGKQSPALIALVKKI